MKKLIYIIAFTIGIATYAEAQQYQIADLDGINYQAVAIDEEGNEIVGKDINGKPFYNKAIGVRFTITSGADGPIYYQESHSTNTDQNGLFSLVIGHGETTAETQYTHLMDIPWIEGDQFLMVEIASDDDGDYRMVSNQKLMTVPFAFYADDIADQSVTTPKIVDEAVRTQEIMDSTILNEDIATGSVDTRTILDSTILNEDVSTGAIDSRTILDSTIINEDIATGAVDTRTILDSTILAEDLAEGSVTTVAILNETILAEDIATGAVTTDEILNETILAEDIATGAVTTDEILNETILAEDIATGAVTTDEILDETILAEDIATGAVTTDEILDGTILNEDIANLTIDLTQKVTGILPVENGGTGVDGSVATDGQVLIGNGTNNDFDLANLTPGAGINIINTPGGVEIESTVSGINAAVAANPVNPGMIGNNASWTSPAIPVPGAVNGDIVIGSIDASLQGCTMTCYVDGANTVRIVIANNTGGNVIFGAVNPKVLLIN